jgi:hypothetical protein
MLLTLMLAVAAGPTMASFKGTPPSSALGVPAGVAENETGFARARLWITAAGKVETCEIIVPSKYPAFDAAVCRSMAGAVMIAATDQRSRPVYSTKMISSSFYKETPPAIDNTDVFVQLDALPVDARTPSAFATLVVAADGLVEACAVTRSSGNATLDALVCTSGVEVADVQPVADAQGTAIRSVQGFVVTFVAGAKP